MAKISQRMPAALAGTYERCADLAAGPRLTAVVAGSDAVVGFDLAGVVTHWNAAAGWLYGYSAERAVGHAFCDLVVPPDRRSELDTAIESVRRGEVVDPFVTLRLRADGARRWVSVRLTPVVEDDALVGLVSVDRDVTAHVETRDALARSEDRHRALVDALTEVVLVTDAEGRVRGPQPSWEQYTGQAASDSAGLRWRAAVHPDDRNGLAGAWAAGAVAGETFRVGFRLHHDASGEHRHCTARVAPIRRSGQVREWVAAIADVHEQHELQQQRRTGAPRFQRRVASNVVGVCRWRRGRLVEGNQAFLDIVGVTQEELARGIAVREVMGEEVERDARAAYELGGAAEHDLARRDGTTASVLVVAVDIDPPGDSLAIVVDVTARKRAEDEARFLALHDPLTGLPNRRLLIDRLDHALARAARHGGFVGVLFCDLDRFKVVNDVYGHAAGDHVLKEVARRLSHELRDGDTVARVGGDEFIVLLEDVAEPGDSAATAERLRSELAVPIRDAEREYEVTASIGVTVAPAGPRGAEALLAQADDAMYRAKHEGRDRVEVLAPEVLTSQHERRRIELALRRALARDELELAFQPVIDLRDHCPSGVEALLRWSIEGTPVPAGRTIAVAEETGIITRVSDWVLQRAASEFTRWRRDHPQAQSWKLHVNVSARDLGDPRFVERVLENIEAGGCAPEELCLEVTETAVIRDEPRAHARLTELRERGVTVAIDDFGTGFASLSSLRDLPADVVKVDQRFVAGLGISDRDGLIVRSTIDLAHDLGLSVVGEGVETLAQISLLDELGCDSLQGYALARPGPIGTLVDSLRSAT